jgi:maleate isomerase
VKFTTPITAAVKACKVLGLKRIAVLTPYVDEVNEPIRQFLEKSGVAVGAFGSFHLLTEPEIASVPVSAIVEAGKALDAPGIDGVFVSCTGMRGHAALDALERATGKPCLSSNQAQLWDALSLIGHGHPIQGFGGMLARLGKNARSHAAA